MSGDNLPQAPEPAGEVFRFDDGEGPPARAPEEGYPGAYAREEELGLGEILRVLRRRIWWIAGGFLLVLGLAAFYTWRQTPVWRASTLIRTEETEKAPAQRQQQLAVSELFSPTSQIETEMRVVTTRPTLEPVVDRLDLNFVLQAPPDLPRVFLFSATEFARETPAVSYEINRTGPDRYRLEAVEPEGSEVRREFAAGDSVVIPGGSFTVAPADTIRAHSGSPPPERFTVRTQSFSVAVASLAGQLSVIRPDPEANLFRIQAEGTDRWLVRDVLREVASAYLQRRNEVQKTRARSTVAFLNDQIDRIETQLEAAETELQDFREERQVVALETEAQTQVQQLANLRAQRTQLSSERDALETLMRKVRSAESPNYRRLAAFPTFLRNSAVQDILQRLTEVEQRRSAMLERRTENHPDVVALDEQIAQLESRLGEIGRNYLSSLNDQIASLDAVLARYGSELEEVPGKELQYARLERRVELLTELHTMLQKNLQEAEIQEAVEDPSVRVVEAAVLPRSPVSPKPERNLLFGGFLGLMLGVALALVREYTDTSLHTEEEADERLAVPVLARVPRLPGGKGRDASQRGETLVAQSAGRSLSAESYRTLRTNIRYARAGRDRVRLIVITSPGAQDGKSTTAGNLAVTFAQQGHRSLIVDADMRKAVQHRAFGVEGEPGLAEFLVGDVELQDCIRDCEIDNLSVLPAGARAPNPAELLDSPRMARLLGECRESFGAVVMDTPPALVVADASILGSRCDGVLMVVRADQTDRKAAEDALEQLQRVNAHVLGVVFNDAQSNGKYGYYRYRYYRDYYGDGQGSGKRGYWRRLLPTDWGPG